MYQPTGRRALYRKGFLLCKTIPGIHGESRGLLLLIVPDADEAAGRGEGVPGDVKPVGGGEELVGMRATSEKVDEALELGWVLGMDVGGLADEVLRAVDTTDEGVDAGVAET